jgi:hypothetical protein
MKQERLFGYLVLLRDKVDSELRNVCKPANCHCKRNDIACDGIRSRPRRLQLRDSIFERFLKVEV